MNKQITIWVAVIAAALLISGYIASQLRATHQADCYNHKILLEQAYREFPNVSGLNGQTLPQIQYLNDHCNDVATGNITKP